MKRISVQQHAEWRIRLAQSQAVAEQIDDDIDEMLQIDPYEGDPPSKRKDSELDRVLSILDTLRDPLGERGSNSDEL